MTRCPHSLHRTASVTRMDDLAPQSVISMVCAKDETRSRQGTSGRTSAQVFNLLWGLDGRLSVGHGVRVLLRPTLVVLLRHGVEWEWVLVTERQTSWFRLC